MKRKYLIIILLPLLLCSFLSVGYSQTVSDTSIISMAGADWSLKVDSALASSIDSRNTPYMTSKSATEKELFLQLSTLEDCKSGVVQFKVDMVGLTAYKQLPLDLELDVKEYEFINSTHAINNSRVVVYRPENVVNSFALFDESGRKQMHISASKLVASDGATVWCDSNLVDGLLTVVLPAQWLQSAKFPVVLDPTFGYTSIGATNSQEANYIFGAQFNCTETGTGDSMSVYVNRVSSDYKVKLGLFTIAESNYTLVAQTDESDTQTGSGWVTCNFTSPPSLSVQTYFLAVVSDVVANKMYDSATINSDLKALSYASCMPASFIGEGSWADHKYSIFLNYTATGEPTPTPTPSPSPSPTPEGATATPFPEGAMDDTDWWISILVLLLIIINIFLMMLPFALVRFTFGILSLFLCMLALSYQVPLSPYLQTAGLLISALAMLFSVRARE